VTSLHAAAVTVAARHATLAIGTIVVLSTLLRVAVSTAFDVPWIAPDEMIYGLVGESFWETGELSVRGISIPYYSLLTPLLVGFPLTLDDRETGIAVAQGLQALAISLVAVPVYLWGKRLAGSGWGLVAALLSVLPPALWYGGLLMTEALFYPLVVVALFALARMLETPSVERQGVFLLCVSVAAAVRLQALGLLPVLILAVGLYAWFSRSGAIVRRLAPILGLVGVATALLLVLYATGSGDLLGAYGGLAESTPSSTGLLSQLTWHSAGVVVLAFGLPVLATATLAVLAALHGETSPPVRAFLAVTTAYVPILVGQVSLVAVDYLDHVGERYLITALPPLLLGLCVWIDRGAPRPAAVAVPLAVASIVLVATLPAVRVGTARIAHDTLTALPFVQILEPGDLAFRAGLVLCALAAGAVFLFLPQRLLRAAVGGLALVLVATSALAAREIDRLSRVEQVRDFGTAASTWVDDADGDSVVLVDTGEQPSTSIARLTFWNRSVRGLARLEGVPEQALPQVPVSIRRDGTLVDGRGSELEAFDAVVPATIVLAGERIASSPPTEVAPGSGLWRVGGPIRFVSRAEGFTPVGDFGRAQVVVYQCVPGTLGVTLLGKGGHPVRITVNGFPWETVELPSGGAWRGTIRPFGFVDEASPCVFQFESDGLVGSTRLEWVPDS